MNKAARFSMILVAGLASPGVPAAQEIPLEVYGRLPAVASMAISPGGDRIAFRRTNAEMDGVFVVDRGSGDTIGGVDGSRAKVRDIGFIDQDRLVLSATVTPPRDLWYSSWNVNRSFLLDLRTHELKALLENSAQLYPYSYLFPGIDYIAGHDPHRDAIYMPAVIDRGGGPLTLGLFEVSGDNPNGAVIAKGVSDTVDWFVDDQGQILAEEEFNTDSDRRRIWSRRDGKRELIYESGPNEPPYEVAGLSRDFGSLIVSARVAGSEFSSYFRMDLDDGSVGPPLFQRKDASIERALVDTSRRVYGVEYSGFFPRYEFFDAALTERVQAVQASLKSTAAYLVDWTPDFRVLLFRLTGGWTSGAYVIVDPESPAPKLVMNIREDIPRETLAPTSVIRYAARDGLQIPALVTARAEVREAGKAPLVVLPHGGPAAYDRYGFDWLVQYFASRGIVVLQPQFRGSTGFGVGLQRAGKGEWGATMSTDLDDGVRRLVDDGLADPARVCMVGSDYGGYAALAAGAFSTFDYKCLVSIAGMSDLPDLLEPGPGSWRRIQYWQRQIDLEDTSRKDLDVVSPVNFADDFKAPVLLVHGRDDGIVPLQQSSRMEKALREAGKPVKLIRLEGEGHYLSGYETRLEALRAIGKFIDVHLLGRDDPKTRL